MIYLAVNGTLMRDLELNLNLVQARAIFVREAVTAPVYRLWSIQDRHPAMMRVTEGGVAIALEIWALPPEGLSQILMQEPPGLCIGKVLLANDEVVLGVLGEAFLCQNQLEISQWGGWRSYIATQQAAPIGSMDE
ncbi:MAG: glutamyl-tRNA amidotransferase [Synechococcales bacterium]|nr:glutamyl-tRNA amidotransferase [Synechococcales bacterium]